MSVAGDWAYIPSDWKVVDGEDPMLGIPTTYYAAVQVEGRATVLAEPDAVAAVLRAQLSISSPIRRSPTRRWPTDRGSGRSGASPSRWTPCGRNSSTAATSTSTTGTR